MFRIRFAGSATVFVGLLLAGLSLSACSSSRSGTGPKPQWPGATDGSSAPSPVRTKDDGSEVDQLYARALAAAKRRDYVEARISLKRVLNRDPWHLDAHQTYQDILLAEGRFEEAHAEYTQLLGEAPDQGEALWLYMRVMLTKRVRTTEESGQTDAEQSTKLAMAYAAAQSSLGKVDSARTLQLVSPCVQARPLHIAGHRLYQDVKLAGPDPQAALKALMEEYRLLRDELEISGDAIYLYERLASLEDPVESSLSYAKAVSLDLPGYWLYYGFGRLAAERAAASDDDNEKLALLRLSRDLYGVCIRTDELIWEAYHGRGVAHQALGDLKEAASDLAFALSLLGDSVDENVLLTLAEVEAERGEAKRALEFFGRGKTVFPKNPWFLIGLAGVHADAGSLEEAATHYRQALPLLPKDDPTLEEIAKWLREKESEGKIAPQSSD